MTLIRSGILWLVLCVSFGCSGNESDAVPGGAGGAAGEAGAGGAAGEAGAGGAAGEAGTGGSAGEAGTGGSAGEAGTGGSAGEAGTGGSAGEAGTGGAAGEAGTGGSAGEAGTGGAAGEAGTGGAAGEAGTGGMAPVFENCGNDVLDLADGEECDGDVQGCTECIVDAVDISAGGSFDGDMGIGSFDRYRLELTVDSAVRIETTGADGTCPGDTVMTLWNESEDTVVFDRNDSLALDDGPNPPCSLLEGKIAAGVYHLIIREYNDDDALAYQLDAVVQELVADGGACRSETEEQADDCVLGASCREMVGGENICVVDGCGNGFVDEGEGCDDGNLEDADGCSSQCFDETLCGNNVVNTGEECDENATDCLGCLVQPIDVSAGGTFPGSFGSGSFDRFNLTVTDTVTVQIDTNDVGGDCVLIDTVMYLGRLGADGVEYLGDNDDRAPGEYCSRITQILDPGTYEIFVNNYFGGAIASYELTVTFLGGCGDSVIDEGLGETCDDGNTVDGDGCSTECIVESVCGNGLIQDGETCDDDSADCVACQVVPLLMEGTGIYDGSIGIGSFDLFDFSLLEETEIRLETIGTMGVTSCDDDLDTRLEVFEIVNGQQIPLIEDPDTDNGTERCERVELDLNPGAYQAKVTGYGFNGIVSYKLVYSFLNECGNGDLDVGETCDDGDTIDGDGCSATCQSEATCGNSRPDADEQCDDGNQNNGDGCSVDCLFEVTEVYEAMDSFSGAISGSDDRSMSSFHEYRITVDAPSVLTAYTSPSAVCDTNNTVLTVYALNELDERTGEALIENDNEDEVSLCSFIDAFNLEQGRYAVVVSGFGAVSAYNLDLMLTRDASTTGDYLGLMQDVGSDGFDIDVAATSDLTAYVTVDGNCVIGSHLSLYGADLENPIAGPANFVVLESGCEGIRLDDLASDLYYLELRSDELQQREYVLHISVEERVEPNSVDYCELKWPDNLGPVAQGYETDEVYAHVYEAGVTDLTTGVDASALVQGQIGYGPSAQEPMTGGDWMWIEAAPNVNYGPNSDGYAVNNDEYTTTLIAPMPGTYDFAARFTVDGGQTWTLCDFDGSNNGYQADAAGRLTVARVPTPGELLITEILYDSNLAGDVAGEWFEVQNTTGEVLSLVGLTLSDEGTDSINLDVLGPWDSGALIQPGAFAVFARESDTAVNGGVNADYAYGNAVGLANDNDELILTNGSGLIDQVNWTGRTIFDVNGSAVGANIDPVGASISLSGDGSGTWCEGVGDYGAGGEGTPGVANPICACADGTFDHDDNPLTACQTCDVCADGTVESAACTPTSNTQCAACPDGACDCAEGTFDHDDNPLTACQSCDACSAGEVETAACTPTSNRECEACAADTVDHDDDPSTACQACEVCADGEVETASCTPSSDTQCEPCGAGTFDEDNDPNTACLPCDTCGDDEVETASCTPTSNTQCEAPVAGWTEADVRSKVSVSCAGCHAAGSHSSWGLGLIYLYVKADFEGQCMSDLDCPSQYACEVPQESETGIGECVRQRNRMPKNAANGGFWSAEDIEKLRVLIEGI